MQIARPRTIVIIGFSGAGKTTVGQLLAILLGRDYYDVDLEFEKKYGPLDAYIERYGIEAFRKLETAIFLKLLEMENAVIATGGGTLLDAENRRLAREKAIVVLLKVSLDVARERVRKDPSKRKRPLFKGNVGQLFAEREPMYGSAQHYTVDADKFPQEVVDELLTILDLHGSVVEVEN